MRDLEWPSRWFLILVPYSHSSKLEILTCVCVHSIHVTNKTVIRLAIVFTVHASAVCVQCTYFVSAVCCSIHCISTVCLWMVAWIKLVFVMYAPLGLCFTVLWGGLESGPCKVIWSVLWCLLWLSFFTESRVVTRSEDLWWVLDCHCLWQGLSLDGNRLLFCLKRLIKPICARWLLNCLQVCLEPIRELLLTVMFQRWSLFNVVTLDLCRHVSADVPWLIY